MTGKTETTRIAVLFTALLLCQPNSDHTKCVPVDNDHPLCTCTKDENGKILWCSGYCDGELK